MYDNSVFDTCICRSPKLSLNNAKGISNEDVSELQNELRRMAADLVGEVRCTYMCSEWTTLYVAFAKFLHCRY